jgi:hypothetical protein
MNEQAPSYYRARIAAFRQFIMHSDGNKNKDSPYELLKYGFIHPNIDNRLRVYIKGILKTESFSNEPLSFTELCSFNTWFAMHPEKIAGKEILTSSIQFPLTIIGTKEDIQRVIGLVDIGKNNKSNQQKRIRIARVKAQAKIKILQLLHS